MEKRNHARTEDWQAVPRNWAGDGFRKRLKMSISADKIKYCLLMIINNYSIIRQEGLEK